MQAATVLSPQSLIIFFPLKKKEREKEVILHSRSEQEEVTDKSCDSQIEHTTLIRCELGICSVTSALVKFFSDQRRESIQHLLESSWSKICSAL